MTIERVMILSMLYVTCVGHLHMQGFHWSGGQYVLRVIRDVFTVDAQTLNALHWIRDSNVLGLNV